jgi:hypothetical protein
MKLQHYGSALQYVPAADSRSRKFAVRLPIISRFCNEITQQKQAGEWWVVNAQVDISQFRHLVFGNFGENLCKVFSCKRLVFREGHFKNCCFFAFFVIFLQKFTKIIKNTHFLD